MRIKNIVFDFGGVLYEINVELTINAFKKIGIDSKPWQIGQDSIFNRIETGHASPEEMIRTLKGMSSASPSDEEILEAFNAVLIGLYRESLAFLLKLKPHYNIYLLSNTNEIHCDKFTKEILKNPQTNSFYACFDKEYYSFRLGMRKPDPKIFEFILKDSQLDPGETLFVDDTKENLINARKLGIQTFWMKGLDDWNIMIHEFGLKTS